MFQTNRTFPAPLDERRRYPRLNFTGPVSFRDVFNPHESFTGAVCRDVSAGGVRLIGSKFVPEDSRVVLVLTIPGELRPMRMISRVAWVKEQSALGESYDCGLEFIEINPGDQEIVAGYVERGIVRSRAHS